MSQRILERGQIESLASRSIPRIRLPDRDTLFAARAARLRTLAGGSQIAAYLQLLAVIADAQQALLADTRFVEAVSRGVDLSAAAQARDAGMPQVAASNRSARPKQWQQALRAICTAVQADPALPEQIHGIAARVGAADADWLEAQADALLGVSDETGGVDAAAAPLLMAALQVAWVAIGSAFDNDALQPMTDAPGLCPLCGTEPVASVVHAKAPWQAYRYLHCALCACEWHQVRVLCSHCGAGGPDIAYRSLLRVDGNDDANADDNAVRAETCEQCQAYRKIMYVEKDPHVDAVADDLGTLALDLLLGEQGYARLSGNPLLWQAGDA